jgi:hypothetical protein
MTTERWIILSFICLYFARRPLSWATKNWFLGFFIANGAKPGIGLPIPRDRKARRNYLPFDDDSGGAA